MRWTACIVVPLLVVACGSDTPQELDVVATFEDGELTFTEVEERVAFARSPACVAARRSAGGGALEDLIPCYREVAESLALERHLAAQVPDLKEALEDLGKPYLELRKQAYLEAYLQRLRESVDVPEVEVIQHFENHREDYSRPGQRTVWNIFRRYEDPNDPEATYQALRDLRRRCLAGEAFGQLARQYSHSETRLRDGLVGSVREGRLPPRLEQIAFALDQGEVSEPVPVAGGAVLLHVTNVVKGVAMPFDDVREVIYQQLTARQVWDLLTQRADRFEPPHRSVLLTAGELIGALDDNDEERVILDVYGPPLEADELRSLFGLGSDDLAEDIAGDLKQQIQDYYLRELRIQLVVLDILQSSDPDDQKIRDDAAGHLLDEGAAMLLDKDLVEETELRVKHSDVEIRRYFEDNQQHYLSELAFKLKVWDLPFDDEPPRQLTAMEGLRDACEKGDLDLTGAAAQLGGSVRDLGWRQLSELEELPPKARSYLLQVGEGGYSVPFQQDGALHLMWVKDRREPIPQPYVRVIETVHDDYLARFGQEIYRQVTSDRLAKLGFVFIEQNVRAMLMAPAVEMSSGAR